MELYFYFVLALFASTIVAYAITKKDWAANLTLGIAFTFAGLKDVFWPVTDKTSIILYFVGAAINIFWAWFNYRKQK